MSISQMALRKNGFYLMEKFILLMVQELVEPLDLNFLCQMQKQSYVWELFILIRAETEKMCIRDRELLAAMCRDRKYYLQYRL